MAKLLLVIVALFAFSNGEKSIGDDGPPTRVGGTDSARSGKQGGGPVIAGGDSGPDEPMTAGGDGAVVAGGHIVVEGDVGPSRVGGGLKTCQDGMKMVKEYLETSKIELIDNIRAAKRIRCKLQAWRKVDPSMVAHSHKRNLNMVLKSDAKGGLLINAKVTLSKCTKNAYAHMFVHIKGNWKQIMYTQVFKGSANCWKIFGSEVLTDPPTQQSSGIEDFNPSMGDIIFGEKRMGSSKSDPFVGKIWHCDRQADSFWHASNGDGERQATVLLRRKKGAKDAGIYTFTSCGTPEYTIKDIFVLM